MPLATIRQFQTLAHPCGYFSDRTTQNLVLDPASPHLAQIYDSALAQGYRRSGGHVYRPRCQQCQACIAARIPIPEFQPSRSQRRCQQTNRDLQQHLVAAEYSEEHFQLYRRYVTSRHADGGMDNLDIQDFHRFLHSAWSSTQFLEFRLNGKLLAVAVTDFTRNALSAVYCYYEPTAELRGLGTYAILSQIELARTRQLRWLYLGYWIEQHPKMDYKARFQPLEILRERHWQRLRLA